VNYEKEYGACQEILEFHRQEDWTKVPLYNVTAYHGKDAEWGNKGLGMLLKTGEATRGIEPYRTPTEDPVTSEPHPGQRVKDLSLCGVYLECGASTWQGGKEAQEDRFILD